MSHPYKDSINTEEKIIRTFSKDTPAHELVWHRDREDRLVKVLSEDSKGWMVQLDNELPIPLTEVFIPAGVYHRVIKGQEDLVVEIHKTINSINLK